MGNLSRQIHTPASTAYDEMAIWRIFPDSEGSSESSYNAPMRSSRYPGLACRHWGCITAFIACAALPGCVERTIHITSDPSGALVHLNDEEVGRTPLSVPFLFYGTYDVRLEHEGYKPLWTAKKTDTPWWEAPGPDLFAEMIPNLKAQQYWHFSLELMPLLDDRDLVDRAWQLRATMAQPNPDQADP